MEADEYSNLLEMLEDPLPALPPLPAVVAERSSSDSAVNQFGRRLLALCQTANLLILIGRTEGDRAGKCMHSAVQ